jgi:nitric oxide reductase subunit B
MVRGKESEGDQERWDDLGEEEPLSSWWRYGALAIVLGEFVVLISIAAYTYSGDVGAPIPAKVVDDSGQVIFTGDDILEGQQVFLKYNLMDNGTLWGHGAYLGPDFSATYLHNLALEVRDFLAHQQFGAPYDRLSSQRQERVRGELQEFLRENRYDAPSRTLRFTAAEINSYHNQTGYWKRYFADSKLNRGLYSWTMQNPAELRPLVAFFAWAAWSAVAWVPGQSYSYTQNFPYDPLVGNGPSSIAIFWSALSLIALLAGTAAILFAFGRLYYLGWHGRRPPTALRFQPGNVSQPQRAALKYFALAAAMFLGQVFAGGAIAHYRVEPGSFYGIPLSSALPSNLLRAWHLQLAILWIATTYIGAGLFMASALGRRSPRWQVLGIHVLFGAVIVLVVGSLTGELLGILGMMGPAWFWVGNQGWEYLELGRGWQIFMIIGFVIWALLLIRATLPAVKDRKDREISLLFLGAAFAIPLFYTPALYFGSTTHFTRVDTWRFWIIHLWVEGFFELFTTVMVAVMFYKIGVVRGVTARRVIYLDAILFLGAGILGTGHHWYWTGQTSASMAISATFSAMEVVPLILLTLDAWDFIKVTHQAVPHKWAFYFLIAVGVWNFVGAGIFGFLINLPVVSYYEVGTNFTVNHGHGALMGVFGMLAAGLMVFALRQSSSDETWKGLEKYVKVSFWGLNIGLAGMLLLGLFPTGFLQMRDVTLNGYWHARSAEFLDWSLMRGFEWARLPADLCLIFLGALPLCIATFIAWRKNRRSPAVSA